MTKRYFSVIIFLVVIDKDVHATKCGYGGIGRRARLRGVWLTPCQFKSGYPHHIAGLCKGSTSDSDSLCSGSNPDPAAKKSTCISKCFFVFLRKLYCGVVVAVNYKKQPNKREMLTQHPPFG